VIVKVPHVGDVEMDPVEAYAMADNIRSRAHVELPLATRRYPDLNAYTSRVAWTALNVADGGAR